MRKPTSSYLESYPFQKKLKPVGMANLTHVDFRTQKSAFYYVNRYPTKGVAVGSEGEGYSRGRKDWQWKDPRIHHSSMIDFKRLY